MTTQTLAVKKLYAWANEVEVDRPNDRLLLLTLIHFDLKDHGAFPKHATLASGLKLGVSTVEQALRRLRRRGLIEVEKRFRANGSQTTNKYRFCTRSAPCGGTTPHDPVVKSLVTHIGVSNTSPSETHALRAKKVKAPVNDFHDDWDGHVEGRADASPKAKSRRRSRPLRSGNDDVHIKVIEYNPLKWRTRGQARAEASIKKRAALRTAAPMDTWNSMDLAQAWRKRLWEQDLAMHHSKLPALAQRFAMHQRKGVSNETLDEISRLFFADRRRWRELPGEELWRAFLAQTDSLLAAITKKAPASDDFWAAKLAEQENQ